MALPKPLDAFDTALRPIVRGLVLTPAQKLARRLQRAKKSVKKAFKSSEDNDTSHKDRKHAGLVSGMNSLLKPRRGSWVHRLRNSPGAKLFSRKAGLCESEDSLESKSTDSDSSSSTGTSDNIFAFRRESSDAFTEPEAAGQILGPAAVDYDSPLRAEDVATPPEELRDNPVVAVLGEPEPCAEAQDVHEIVEGVHILYEKVRGLLHDHTLLLKNCKKELKRAGFVPRKNGFLKPRNSWGRLRPSRKSKLVTRAAALEELLLANADSDSEIQPSSETGTVLDNGCALRHTTKGGLNNAPVTVSAKPRRSSWGDRLRASRRAKLLARTAALKKILPVNAGPELQQDVSGSDMGNSDKICASRDSSSYSELEATGDQAVNDQPETVPTPPYSAVGDVPEDANAPAEEPNDAPVADSGGPEPYTELLEDVRCLGKGSYGVVILARNVMTGTFVAKKVLSKEQIYRHSTDRLYKCAFREKELLQKTSGCNFIVQLLSTAQTSSQLHLILELSDGGDLSQRIGRPDHNVPGSDPLSGLSRQEIQFYAACVVLGIQELHSRNILHRDLKPENFLIFPDGYVKIADFGLAELVQPGEVVRSAAGTMLYMAPEVAMMGFSGRMKRRSPGAGHASDWWSFGIFLFELVAGYEQSPYIHYDDTGSPDAYNTLLRLASNKPNRISDRTYRAFCKWPEIDDLIGNLLTRVPERRMQKIQDIQQHPFFAGIDWQALAAHRLPAPWKPETIRADDLPCINANSHKALMGCPMTKEMDEIFRHW